MQHEKTPLAKLGKLALVLSRQLSGEPVIEFYRFHMIFLLRDAVTSAEMIEQATGVILPTKMSANWMDTDLDVMMRAKALVDVYLEPSPS